MSKIYVGPNFAIEHDDHCQICSKRVGTGEMTTAYHKGAYKAVCHDCKRTIEFNKGG